MLSHSDNDQKTVSASTQLENVTTPGPDFEPQDEEVKGGVIEQILEKQLTHTKQISELGKTMPIQLINSAKEFIPRFKEFRQSIDQDLDGISEQLLLVKQKFMGQIHSNDNKKGVLTSKLESYTDCLSFARSNLNKLLDTDEKKWEDNLEQTQKGLLKMTEELQLIIMQQEILVAKVLDPARFIKKKQQVVIKRLLMWGEQVGDGEIDFQWPTQEVLEECKDLQSLYLQKLDF